MNGVSSGIAASSFSEGQGGNVTIIARELKLFDGSEISANANNIGEAGNIAINVAETLLIDQSEVSTNALQADGGDVDITANLLQLRDGRITTSVGDGDGSGGNIRVDARLGLLERSEIRADAFGGPGGNITIQTDGFIADITSQVSASSEQSVDGTVAIQGLVDLAGLLTPIDLSFVSAATLISDRCAGRLQGEGIGHFTLAGRDRIPIAPDGILPRPPARVASVVQRSETHRAWPSPVTSPVVDLDQACSRQRLR